MSLPGHDPDQQPVGRAIEFSMATVGGGSDVGAMDSNASLVAGFERVRQQSGGLVASGGHAKVDNNGVARRKREKKIRAGKGSRLGACLREDG